MRLGDEGKAATEFYGRNREAMDAGSDVAWPERFNADELSAIQNAMNWRIDNPRAFAAEAQNDPIADEDEKPSVVLSPDAIAKRVDQVPRREVPRDCTRLTAFVDCGSHVLWYVVVGWSESFGGNVLDYGTWPRQNRDYFAAGDVRPSLDDLYPTLTEPQRLHAGLGDLTGEVLGIEYPRNGSGEPLRVERCLIDSGWLPDTVHGFCRSSPFAGILHASKGHAAGSNAKPVSEWAVKPGERAGRDWRLSSPASGRGRVVVFDSDSWKSFVADRITTPPGGGGALLLHALDRGRSHQLLADHLAAEFATRITAKGRTYDAWQARPGADNHWLDCLVGAAVAASVQGLRWLDGEDRAEKPPPRNLADVPRQRWKGGRRV